jgi:Tol biopolymer transport system component
MMLLEAEGTDETQLTSRVQDTYDIPLDWSKDGRWILGATNRPTDRSLIARYPVAAAPQAETKLQVVVQSADSDLWEGRYSPDDTLIAFTRVPRSGLGESVVHLVRADGAADVPITERGNWADKPRWAPDGSSVYFISNRITGTFNVWAQRIDLAQGQPIGEPVAVTRFSNPRVMINPLLASVGLSVIPGAIVLPLQELSGNIWLLTRTPVQ